MKELEELEEELERLKEENKKLTDEVIENWKHLVKDLEKDVLARALMVTRKKADA